MQGDWVREAISLNDYMGKKVKLRFRLKSDYGTEMDGYYFDDFNISMLLDPTGGDEAKTDNVSLGIPYPNPADNQVAVSYNLPASAKSVALKVSNVAGVEVSALALGKQKGIATIDVSQLSSGIYFLQLKADGYQSQVRKLVIK